jgi:hypothetical protein
MRLKFPFTPPFNSWEGHCKSRDELLHHEKNTLKPPKKGLNPEKSVPNSISESEIS